MASPADVDKYLKVQRMAQSGSTPGERANAQKIMDKMEREDPTIKTMAEMFEKMQRGEMPFGQGSSNAPSWQEIFNLGKSAFDNISKVVTHSANVAYGTKLADHVEVGVKQSERTGSLSLTFRFSGTILDAMLELSPAQQVAFKTALQVQLDDVLTQIFEADNEEEEEDDDDV